MLGSLKKDFFTSGWDFAPQEYVLKNRFEMINVAILLSALGLLFGISVNIYREFYSLVSLELTLFFINVAMMIVLRIYKQSFTVVSHLITVQYTLFFIYLIYTSHPEDMRHIWIFTYPIILLYFQNKNNGIVWIILMVFMILVAPFQPFVEVHYSTFQTLYMSFVLIIVNIIIYFYQKKMSDARELILSQQEELKEKIAQLTQKDKMLTLQSKQAVMGEMISMIAHQWRQPLSSVTLSVSNIQLRRMLQEQISDEEMDATLSNISETIVYLSETIDDFQTYFRPHHETSTIELLHVLEKALDFIHPRVHKNQIHVEVECPDALHVTTYPSLLIQVLLNILNNAIDQFEEKRIANPEIILRVTEYEEHVDISIRDNGGGISVEILELVFDPYFSTKGKNGTGLGLYMSQMIVQKQLGGDVTVTSQQPYTEFTIVVAKKLS